MAITDPTIKLLVIKAISEFAPKYYRHMREIYYFYEEMREQETQSVPLEFPVKVDAIITNSWDDFLSRYRHRKQRAHIDEKTMFKLREKFMSGKPKNNPLTCPKE